MAGAGGTDGEAEALAAAAAQARLQAEAGDLTGARAALERALDRGELQLGHSHPQLAPLMLDLAIIARSLGNLTEAHRQLRRAYEINMACVGPADPVTLAVQGQLASLTGRLGDTTSAHELYLLETGSEVLGADHPAVRGARARSHAMERPWHDGELLSRPLADHGDPGGPSDYVTQPTTAQAMPSSATPLTPPPPWPLVPLEPPTDDPSGQHAHPRYAAGAAPGVFERQFGAADDATTDDLRTRHTPGPSAPAPHAERVTDIFGPPGLFTATAPSTADGPAVGSMANDDVEPDPHGIDAAPPPPVSLGPPRPRPRPRRPTLVFVSATVGVMLVLAAVAGFYAVRVAARDTSDRSSAGQPATSRGRSGSPGATSTAGTASAEAAASPPTQVRLRDEGGSITLTWHDPAKGTVPFIVAGGRRGVEPIALQTVVAGETRSTIYGLNSHYDYCFTITAVYSTEVVASSARMCTHRLTTENALQGSGDMNRPL